MNRRLYVLVAVLGLALVIGVAWIYGGRQASTASPSTSGAAAVASASTGSGPGSVDSTATGDAPSGASGYVAQDEGQGSVQVSATLLTPGSIGQDDLLSGLAGQVGADEFGIAVTFLTHSVDLSELDLVALSTLRTPKGDVAPLRWVSESDAGHHRSGMLVFPSSKVDLNASGNFSLIMKGIAGVPERDMTWSLPKS